MRAFLREAAFAVVYFQAVLTPVALLWWHMGPDQYLAWTVTNCVLSPFLGIGYARLYRVVLRREG